MRETFVFDILCTYKLYVFRVLFAGNFHNSYLVRRHVPEEAIRHNISQRMMVCAATDSARARARARVIVKYGYRRRALAHASRMQLRTQIAGVSGSVVLRRTFVRPYFIKVDALSAYRNE